MPHGLRFNLRFTKFLKSKTKKVQRGGKSAILPNWCCQQSITVLSTPPFSMINTDNFSRNTRLIKACTFVPQTFVPGCLFSRQSERTFVPLTFVPRTSVPWNFASGHLFSSQLERPFVPRIALRW